MSSAAQICFCSRSKATQKPSAQSKNSWPEPLPCRATGFGSQMHSGTEQHQLCWEPHAGSPVCVCAGSLPSCLPESFVFSFCSHFLYGKSLQVSPVVKGHSSALCCGQCLFCIVEIIYMGISRHFPHYTGAPGLGGGVINLSTRGCWVQHHASALSQKLPGLLG